MSNRAYDILKYFTLIALPALTTLVGILMKAWQICDADMQTAIVTTMTAIDAFLGTCLQISTSQYKAGNANHGDND